MRQHITAHHSPSSNIDQCTAATYASDTRCQRTGSPISDSSGIYTFKNVEFKDCSSSNDNGGAIKCTGSNTELIVTGCTFTSCHTEDSSIYYGGGVFAHEIASVSTKSCVFTTCYARRGGGFHINYIQSTPDFSDCVFVSCKGYELGGGSYVGRCTKISSFLACKNCIFIQGTDISESSSLRGGGLYLDIYANTHVNTLSNILFTKNSVNSNGGGINIYESEMNFDYSIKFCFFSDNNASNKGQDISLRRITFDSLLHCYTTSDAPDRLYLVDSAYETSSSTDTTNTPNWLPEGNCHSSLGNRETVKITYP